MIVASRSVKKAPATSNAIPLGKDAGVELSEIDDTTANVVCPDPHGPGIAGRRGAGYRPLSTPIYRLPANPGDPRQTSG